MQYVSRATARSWIGDLAGAVADLERVLELDPDQPDVVRNLETHRKRLAEQEAFGD